MSTPEQIMKSTLGTFGGEFQLIRDYRGHPVIDDGNLMPEKAKQELLTQSEREALANDRFAWRRNAQ